MVAQGTFRQDLFFRLGPAQLRLPSLQERQEDLMPLTHYFIARAARALGKPAPTLSLAAQTLVQTYPWPGNVRELKNVLETAVQLCPGPSLRLQDLRLFPPEAAQEQPILPLAEYERRYLEQVLARTGWVIKGPEGAAARLGLNPETLRSRLKKLGIQRPQTQGNTQRANT